MVRIIEVTKQDRLSHNILNKLASIIIAAKKGMSYDDIIKNGLGVDNITGIIDFGISEGAFMPSYKLKRWLETTKEFFEQLPPQNILIAIYKELQQYPQGSIRGHK